MPTTNDLVRFEDIRPEVPDLDALARESDGIRARLSRANDEAECFAAVEDWDRLRREVQSHEAMVHLRFNQDTCDEERKAAREAWDAAAPRWTELQVEVKRTLLGHPLRATLEQRLGAQAFALWESDTLAFDPAIKEDLTREADLGAKYTELRSGAELDFRGETLNLSTIGKHRQSPDRAVRHEAQQVTWDWFGENGEAFDGIYEELVRLRHGMAKALGLPDFVDLGYKRMCRVDYDRNDVERLRSEIVREVVPLAAELRARQARDLGVDPLMAWDESVHDLAGNPTPRGDRDWMVARAREMFDSMGSGLGDFFRRMDEGDLLDLSARHGKAGGGFCTSFPTHGMPFVFANFNGTKDDVDVLTHEMGHAFQYYSSCDQPLSDYAWPTYESAEIHSMSLEFLAWPHMEAFFGEDGERYRRTHLTEALLFLPYGTAVDHFQHLVYGNPTATPEERHAMWLEMERTYLPWRNWGDLGYPGKGGRWQFQGHVYLDPFYYVDYVLAQICALQFWAAAEKDRTSAMDAYVALCGRGGSLPFQALVRSAGLTSPFEEGCLTRVVEHARRTALS